MAETPNFIDYIKVICRSGSGGKGSIHFRRDKFTPRGGPDGGDGGKGGSIILKGNKNLWTLLHLKFKKHLYASDGENGARSNRSGESGNDVTIEVPLGTIAKNPATNEILCEVLAHDQEVILLSGGRGGWGNQHFATATHQAPMYAQDGEPGREEQVILELKLLADVGLVGFPNAGKSTLLSKLSAAKPEIADYAFTTLVPQLGIVKYKNHQSFVMADLPGIVEGAHEGKGLGHRFLRHIERNSMLLFMISVESNDVGKEYAILRNELKQYNPDLLYLPRLLAITKSDLIDDELERLLKKELPKTIEHVFISSFSGKNLEKLKDKIWKMLNE